MAIYLAVVRTGMCELCSGQFIIPDPQSIPERCIHCGSTLWLYGLRTNRGSLFVRQGISTVSKELNKGATSAKRVAQGKKQWRRFRSKENQKEEKADPPTT